MRKAQKGFTLLEIIIVIGILALLLTIIAPEFSGLIQSSKSSMAYSNAEILYNHIDELLYTDIYRTQENKYGCATECYFSNRKEDGNYIISYTKSSQEINALASETIDPVIVYLTQLVAKIENEYITNGAYFAVKHNMEGTYVYYWYKENATTNNIKNIASYDGVFPTTNVNYATVETGTRISRNTFTAYGTSLSTPPRVTTSFTTKVTTSVTIPSFVEPTIPGDSWIYYYYGNLTDFLLNPYRQQGGYNTEECLSTTIPNYEEINNCFKYIRIIGEQIHAHFDSKSLACPLNDPNNPRYKKNNEIHPQELQCHYSSDKFYDATKHKSFSALLENITILNKIELQNMEIGGPIPNNIGNNINLESIFLSDLRNFDKTYDNGTYYDIAPIDNTIPSSLGKCTNLMQLYIVNVPIHGGLPKGLASLEGSLNKLQITGTHISYISEDLANLIKNVDSLYIASNKTNDCQLYSSCKIKIGPKVKAAFEARHYYYDSDFEIVDTDEIIQLEKMWKQD